MSYAIRCLVLGVLLFAATETVAKCAKGQKYCLNGTYWYRNPMGGGGGGTIAPPGGPPIIGPPFSNLDTFTYADLAVPFGPAGAAGGLDRDDGSSFPQRTLLSTNSLPIGGTSMFDDQLWVYDPLDDSIEPFGNVLVGGTPLSMEGLAFNVYHQSLYAWGTAGATEGLYAIDLADDDGDTTFEAALALGAFPGSNIRGIDADPDTGLIYLADNGTSLIYEVDATAPVPVAMSVTGSDFMPSMSGVDGAGMPDVPRIGGVGVINGGVFLFSDDSEVDIHVFDLLEGAYDAVTFASPFPAGVSEATAGAFYNFGATEDYNGDGEFNCEDLDLLVNEIVAGTAAPRFDLDGDGAVDATDIDVWLAEIGAVENPSGGAFLPGDANLDGVVDVTDLNRWNGSKFTSNAGWCGGDFNADGVTDVSDLNVWNSFKFQASDGQLVPEPSSSAIIGWCLLLLAGWRRGNSSQLLIPTNFSATKKIRLR